MKKPKKATTIDDLAIMVAKGFEGVQEQLSPMRSDIKDLKEGQEQITLKLDNVAYRFEVVELQRRVDLLEKKVGIRR